MNELFAMVDSLGETPAILGTCDPQTPEKPAPDSLPVRVGIMGLTRSSCRWLMNDASPWQFFGKRKTHGSYCEAHAVKAYRRKGGKL